MNKKTKDIAQASYILGAISGATLVVAAIKANQDKMEQAAILWAVCGILIIGFHVVLFLSRKKK